MPCRPHDQSVLSGKIKRNPSCSPTRRTGLLFLADQNVQSFGKIGARRMDIVKNHARDGHEHSSGSHGLTTEIRAKFCFALWSSSSPIRQPGQASFWRVRFHRKFAKTCLQPPPRFQREQKGP